MKYYCGIDIGASKIFSIIIDENANILGKAKEKLNKSKSLKNLLEKINISYLSAIENSKINKEDILSIGAAVPSAVNIEKGILLNAPNLKLKNIEFSKILYELFNKPVFIDNDVNMGVFGECSHGAGKNYSNVYGVFLGTGIGGGYIRNGEIIRGKNFTAGEIGHIIIEIGGPKCGCGKRGCLEAFSGKVGILNHINLLEKKTKKKSLINKLEPDWKNGVGASILKKCLDKNDELVTQAIKRACRALGIALANVINLIGIDAIILGGGLYKAIGDKMKPLVKKYMEKYSMAGGADNIPLIDSTLQDYAVSFGSAWFTALPQNQKYLYKE